MHDIALYTRTQTQVDSLKQMSITWAQLFSLMFPFLIHTLDTPRSCCEKFVDEHNTKHVNKLYSTQTVSKQTLYKRVFSAIMDAFIYFYSFLFTIETNTLLSLVMKRGSWVFNSLLKVLFTVCLGSDINNYDRKVQFSRALSALHRDNSLICHFC